MAVVMCRVWGSGFGPARSQYSRLNRKSFWKPVLHDALPISVACMGKCLDPGHCVLLGSPFSPFFLKSCGALILYWNTDKTYYHSRDGPRIGVGISCLNSIPGCQGEINYSGQVVKGAIVLHRGGTATIGEAFVSGGFMSKATARAGRDGIRHTRTVSPRQTSVNRSRVL